VIILVFRIQSKKISPTSNPV